MALGRTGRRLARTAELGTMDFSPTINAHLVLHCFADTALRTGFRGYGMYDSVRPPPAARSERTSTVWEFRAQRRWATIWDAYWYQNRRDDIGQGAA